MKDYIIKEISILISKINEFEADDKIEIINNIKKELHKYSPFKKEPIDCVQWIKVENIEANDYNPNSVAPPEMELLKKSIENDGYTQPIVSWKNEKNYEVVDGFHRTRIAKESKEIQNRLHSYVPIVIINEENSERNNRIASTIRHNRARGKHTVDSMSEIVIELKNRNWSNTRIKNELGMDDDEILRLCQMSGLVDLFSGMEYNKSWDIDIFDYIDEND